jgi:hypothetical protein
MAEHASTAEFAKLFRCVLRPLRQTLEGNLSSGFDVI